MNFFVAAKNVGGVDFEDFTYPCVKTFPNFFLVIRTYSLYTP